MRGTQYDLRLRNLRGVIKFNNSTTSKILERKQRVFVSLLGKRGPTKKLNEYLKIKRSCLGVSNTIAFRFETGRFENDHGRLLQIGHSSHTTGVQDKVTTCGGGSSGTSRSRRRYKLVEGCGSGWLGCDRWVTNVSVVVERRWFI